MKQLALLPDATATTENAVIAGDFNEWSMGKGLEKIQSSMTVHASGKSFHTRRPMAALDRIAITHGRNGTHGGVEQGALARRRSAHLPIWLDIVAKTRSGSD